MREGCQHSMEDKLRYHKLKPTAGAVDIEEDHIVTDPLKVDGETKAKNCGAYGKEKLQIWANCMDFLL